MERSKNYHTKQQEIILNYLKMSGQDYVTVSRIATHLKEQGQCVGLTTIYRQLEKFEREGIVHKIVLDGNNGACYQYASENPDMMLLKCEECGGMIPMECSHMEELYEHVLEEHQFQINSHRTMFYGLCENCIRKGKKAAFLLAFLLIFGCTLTGCRLVSQKSGGWADGGQTASGKEKGRLQVVATLFPYYDFVREIAGELADVSLVVPAGMDTHSFEPTAADIIKMGKADVILYNGGENEQWIGHVLDAGENEELLADAMMDHVDILLEEHVEGMQENQSEAWEEKHGGGEHSEHDETDEHIWTSPVNAQKIVEQIAKDLAEADPAHGGEYQKNARNYIERLQELDEEFRRLTEHAGNKYLAFADRFPLRYFVEEYGLDYTAAFAGCSSDTEPSAETITYLTDQVRERKLPVVLKIELTSDKVAKAVAEAAGTSGHPVRVETFYTCHNVTRKQFEQGETYLSLMEKNISVLRDAISK